MERYENNGFCKYLKQHPDKHTMKFHDTTKSLLIVAKKKDNEPLMLIIDDRVTEEEYQKEITDYEKHFGNICDRLAKKSKLPLFWIRYVDREILINSDEISLREKNSWCFKKVKLFELPQIFHENGIEAKLEKRTPQKRKNDSLSSAFHIWQRECLNVGVFADVDLIRLSEDESEILEVIELKRSYYKLKEWRPFYNDLNNFAIVSNFCKKLGNVPFRIVYNEQVVNVPKTCDQDVLSCYYKTNKKNYKNQVYFDKVDRIKVFHVNTKDNVYFYPLPYPELIGEMAIDDYLNNENLYTISRKV